MSSQTNNSQVPQKIGFFKRIFSQFLKPEFWEEQVKIMASIFVTSFLNSLAKTLWSTSSKIEAESKIPPIAMPSFTSTTTPTTGSVGERVWSRSETGSSDFRPPQAYPPREAGNSSFPGFGR